MNFPACDDCATHLDEDNAAPSCGTHDLCIECAPYWTCGGCHQVAREVEEDRAADLDYTHGKESL